VEEAWRVVSVACAGVRRGVQLDRARGRAREREGVCDGWAAEGVAISRAFRLLWVRFASSSAVSSAHSHSQPRRQSPPHPHIHHSTRTHTHTHTNTHTERRYHNLSVPCTPHHHTSSHIIAHHHTSHIITIITHHHHHTSSPSHIITPISM
jgi:hypothetical protein